MWWSPPLLFVEKKSLSCLYWMEHCDDIAYGAHYCKEKKGHDILIYVVVAFVSFRSHCGKG
jgi:hypothetical protein